MKIDTYTKLLHCALSLFVLTAAVHGSEETKGEDKNPNTNNSLPAGNHLADLYHLSGDTGEIGDLIMAFSPTGAANLAVTSKGFRDAHLTDCKQRLVKRGVSSVEIVTDPETKMPGLVINGTPFGDLPELALLEILVKLGDTNAQEELCRLYKINQNSKQLLDLANQGCKPAQTSVAEGYARGQYGFTKDRKQLEVLANQGWEHAQTYDVNWGFEAEIGIDFSGEFGDVLLECNIYGFAPEDSELVNIAERESKLLNIAKQGCKFAQEYLSESYAKGQFGFDQDTSKLLALANQGWEPAQWLVARGYAWGEYGFTQSPNALQALANQGWKPAQWLVTEGYEKGKYGFAPDTNQLLALANQGWKHAQESVLSLHVRGENGLAQQINMAELALAIKFRNNTLFEKYTKTLPMKERIMFILSSLGIDEHA